MDNTTQPQQVPTAKRSDLYQQVTDTIIQQLEGGTVPWHKPWYEDGSLSSTIPKNGVTHHSYQDINIVLLWSSGVKQNFTSNEWASFKQWQDKKEFIRKGEKGSLIVYYDHFEKEVDGEIKKIPFLKSRSFTTVASWQVSTPKS